MQQSTKMGYELMELKTDGSHCELLIRETIMNRITEWEDLPNADAVRRYLKNNPFPKDGLYSEEEFLKEVDGGGYIHLWVEKRETAEFIADLCYELSHWIGSDDMF